ncbi:hypothetical protein PAJL_815 [Cutibacterium acnes HL042PA3]|nr:hypothetical protein HMPREF9206_2311 [Cutibacterium acnes J139]EFS86764.1 hypothetical protein HMPREF9603_01657 [Cutibacterium acnes HL001PA1]EFT10482.1 hypothetical protein HMPREF9619_01086 [Cutibacterium acnes HL082PA2]EFT24955.1 hypothetical protein HMPREF9577_02438 [Cutibacterium acnes HL110PA3]EFT62171.1 hypothetical protein HMPREF9578_02644 [Cutibacterium acnes HL110PA4]EFT65506.1 hypothetical protein HMPREF9582_02468 [Cutibacterium acnes HL060PA1]EFT75034.1 hypothetical protein HMPR
MFRAGNKVAHGFGRLPIWLRVLKRGGIEILTAHRIAIAGLTASGGPTALPPPRILPRNKAEQATEDMTTVAALVGSGQ